jgi:WD40 repeat protein
MHIWEVATWKKRVEFKGHRDRPTALPFAPGGQLLSGGLDTTVLVWDTRK